MTDEYTAAKAARWIASGKAPTNMRVTGYLDLSGTAITALPDNLTVGGYLDLRGLSQLQFPTPWFRITGQASRHRGIVACAQDGYVLMQTDTGKLSAGCHGPWTVKQALNHWGKRKDARAISFVAAIKAFKL